MLASLLLNQPVAFGPEVLRDRIRLKCNTIPDTVVLGGTKAIKAYIAEQVLQDVKAGRATPEQSSITAAEVVQIVNTEVAEINDEIALLFILASLE